MAQEAEKMKVGLDWLNDLAEDYCMLSAALVLFEKEEKELAQKLLNRFLNKYKESELLELLKQLNHAKDELEYFENHYWEPHEFEEGGKFYIYRWYREQLILNKADVNEISDPWL